MKELERGILSSAWKKIGTHPHHGIVVPLSALHTSKSCGIGEFLDLIPLINWCVEVGFDTIQLLPLQALNSDFSPYNPISSCALSELYLSCHALPFLEEDPSLREECTCLQKLTLTPRVSYTLVQTHKLHFLHTYIARCREKLWKLDTVQAFIAKNPWLKPYALFRVLKQQSDDAPITSWASHLQRYHPKEHEKLFHLHFQEIQFHLLVQYLCHTQLCHVKHEAWKRKIHLMGDIPILVSEESADLFAYPDLFDRHLVAGAPPDAYNPEGQYWGFPVPRIDMLRKTHFHFWKQRLKIATHYYDIFRIDHVIGLFHLWSIPKGAPSSQGFYLPKEDSETEAQGHEMLHMIIQAARPMLPIGEDLGNVPHMLRPMLHKMGIPGTKVMRWEKHFGDSGTFIQGKDYPPISLTTLGTHDATPLALWWKEEEKEAKQYAQEKGWEYTPLLTRTQRQNILKESHHTQSLFHINLLQEYLALFPDLVSATPEEERINVPGTFLPSNWTYRFLPSIEELLHHEALKEVIREILKS